MSQVKHFIISDTHHCHDNIYKFVSFDGVTRVRKEWDTAAEADREMVERWNAVVSPEDHVYHLGDVGFGAGVHRIVAQLNGHKRLVLGNHDKDDVRNYRAMGFQKVMGCHQYRRGLWFTHVPMHPLSLGEGGINIHGHIHERPAYGPQYRNVSVERIDYRPQLIEEVLAWKD